MTAASHSVHSRALVLGGGGVTGIAWEVGVLTGLRDAGLDLGNADAIIGTSAGAFVGAAVASGHDMGRMFAAQSAPNDTEVPVVASDETTAAWYDAFATGGSDPRKVGAAFGRIGKSNLEPIPIARRRSVVEGRLVTTDWPAALRVTAIDADTGELHVFDRASGVSLVDAVSASGAVLRVSGRSRGSTAERGSMAGWYRGRTRALPTPTNGSWSSPRCPRGTGRSPGPRRMSRR